GGVPMAAGPGGWLDRGGMLEGGAWDQRNLLLGEPGLPPVPRVCGAARAVLPILLVRRPHPERVRARWSLAPDHGPVLDLQRATAGRVGVRLAAAQAVRVARGDRLGVASTAEQRDPLDGLR